MRESGDDSHSSNLRNAPSTSIPLAPLLNLPPELFLQICNTLPLHTQASLTLTCRSFYDSYGGFNLLQLGFDSSHSRACLSYFLRLLRRDLPDSTQWLCYDCLKFHPCARTQYPRDSHVVLLGGIGKHDPIEGRPSHLPLGSGFPYCNSAFTLSRDYTASLLESGNDARPTVYKGSTRVESKTHGMFLDYTIKLGVGFQGLETWSEYIFHVPDGTCQRQKWSHFPVNERTFCTEQLA